MSLSRTRATLIALCSISLAVQSYGELIMIRHPSKIENGQTVRNITCMSEDDGSAMVWNVEPYARDNSMVFGKAYPEFGSCGSLSCIQWHHCTKCNWSGTSSSRSPMAPVSDYRWEGFLDYQNGMNDPYFKNLEESGIIVFSARGSEDVNVRLGDENTLVNNSCFRIKFPSKIEHLGPIISSCHDQGSDDNTNSNLSPKILKESLVDPSEWRTYIIEWKNMDKIEAFYGKESLVKRKITGSLKFNGLFVESVEKTGVRFHDYKYGMTNITGGYIDSHHFDHPVTNLHIEVLVSLCSKCQLNVHVIDANEIYLANRTIHLDKNFMQYRSPFWQISELIMSWDVQHTNPIILKMIASGDQTGHKDMWAIGSPAIHKSEGTPRRSTIKFTPSNRMTDLSCQKISYRNNETSIVYSNGKITNIESSSLHRCLTAYNGFCDFGCHINTCKGTSICTPDGCTCAPGFTGTDCNEDCRLGWYGYNCRTSCECGGHTCDKINGTCLSGCREYYLPSSDCKKKLTAPSVRCIDENDVVLNYNITKFNEDEMKNLRFEIQKVGDSWRPLDIDGSRQLSDWHWPNKSIADLEPWTYYKVRVVINEIHGEEGSFDTKNWQLSKPYHLTVSPLPNGTVTLKWTHYPNLWEKIQSYEVKWDLLDSRLNGTQTSQTQKTMTRRFVPHKHVYKVKLDLSKATNYTFIVKTLNGFANSTAVDVWYMLPDENVLANIKEEEKNPGTKAMNFRLPYRKDVIHESTVYVAMKRSSTCPRLKRTQDSNNTGQKIDTDNSWIASVQESEYPACVLQFNAEYVFMVGPDNEEYWNLYLCWLLILPIAAVCWVVLCVFYYKRKAVNSDEKPPKIELFPNTKFQQLGEPEDNSIPPEEQRFRRFENYVKRAAENGVLQQQFMSLPKGMVRSCEYGNLPENRPKNRIRTLIAYDETRVLLVRDPRDPYSDYINANYVQGYCKERAYIATQGPLPNTVIDFWRMIWQEEVRIICMLVDLVEDGKNMCERYWPEIGKKETYGDIVVWTTKQRISADYTYRTFVVSTYRGIESQTVKHLQYTGWPGEDVPLYSHSVSEYLQKLLSCPPGKGPIVVHCNSGTGRTGAIILSDICRRRLAADGSVDVFAEAKTMFSARGNMLRTLAQYVLAHLVPTQCLLMLPTKVLCADITQKRIEEMKNNIPAHMKRLVETSWMDKALRPIEPLKPTSEENILKNRFQKRTPVGPNLVTLTRYPTYDTNSDYISAVTVDGVKIRKQYIASQLPMRSTLTDFWRLIIEKNIQLVIILQHPDSEDPTCCEIIPRGTTVVPLPGLKVETKMSSNSNKHFTMDKLLITDISREPAGTKNITALTCKNWKPTKDAQPPSPEILVEVWRASEKIHRDGPTLVLCYDGLTGCGIYLALSFMLERMAVEQECDVVLAVRAVRRSRPDFVRSPRQFEYLYDAAMKYTESFQDYDNFTGVVAVSQRCE